MAFKLAIATILLAISRGGVVEASVVAPAVAVAKISDATIDPNPQYSFAYDVQDTLTGDSKSQVESRANGVVRGQYTVADPDGTRRVVDYYADPVHGFNAVVRRTPQAVVAPVVARAAPVAPVVGRAVAPAVAAPVPFAPVVAPAPFAPAPLLTRAVAAPLAAPLLARAAPAPLVAPGFARLAAPAPLAVAPGFAPAPLAVAPPLARVSSPYAVW